MKLLYFAWVRERVGKATRLRERKPKIEMPGAQTAAASTPNT